MRQYRDDNHMKDAPHFISETVYKSGKEVNKNLLSTVYLDHFSNIYYV